MTLKCSNCGSLNSDDMTACGNCGAQLDRADRIEIEIPKDTGDGTGIACPYCGQPMEEGTFDVPAHQIMRPLWVSGRGEEEIAGYGPGFYEFEGYRCRACSCMLISY